MKKIHFISSILLFVISVILLGYFLYQKYQLGLVRYFDMDEFAYLNWTSHMVQGSIPYKDFLYQLPPGFLLMLAPVFLFSQNALSPLVGGRVVAFFVQCSLILVTGLIFWRVRRRWTAIFACLILAFLPLPADKLMEIRPDTAGVLFAMLGTLFQIMWMEREENKSTTLSMLVSGFFYGVSVFILQKTIPHVAVAAVIVGVWALRIQPGNRIKTLLPFVIGGIALFVPFVFWVLTQQIGPLVWYLLTKFLPEYTQIAKNYPIPANQFFFYYYYYYGAGSWNVGFILNQVIWIVGVLMGILRLLTPNVFGKKYVLSELLLSGVFIVQLVLFIYYMPFKHPQYLIPLAVFVAFYAADAIDEVWQRIVQSPISLFIGVIGFFVLFSLLVRGYNNVNDAKFTLTNTYEKKSLQTMLATIPRNEYVFDLVGLSLYYPQPYYVSCLMVGQFSGYISMKLPSIAQALVQTKTKYIYQGNQRRIMTLLPEDQAYINERFHAVGDGSLFVRNDAYETP